MTHDSRPRNVRTASEKRLALIAFVLSALLSLTFVWRTERHHMALERRHAEDLVTIHADTIQRVIDGALSATYPLAALIREGNGKLANFEALASQMLPYYHGASALVLIPDGVIAQIVPAGNEKAIGLDLFKDPRWDNEARLARDSGQLTLAGPFELVQGGIGAAGRLPVYLGEGNDPARFWGLVSVLIRFPEVLASAELDRLAKQGYAYALWRNHPQNGERRLAIAEAAGPLTNPVNVDIALPNARWTLSAAPVAGWIDTTRLGTKLAVALALSALLAWITGLLVRQRRHRRELESRIEVATGDLRRSLDKAKRLRERFRGYIDNAPTGVFVADATGHYIDVNPAACALVGYSRDELLAGMSIVDLASTADLHGYLEIFAGVLRDGRGEFELALRRKDASRFRVAMKAVVLADGNVMGFATDITESKLIQEALQALAANFSLLTGTTFHQAVCRHLAEQLELDHVFVGMLDESRRRVQVIAGWSMGEEMQVFAYDLLDTPCADVVKRAKALVPAGVQALFAADKMLVQMGIESYVGASLFDKQQQPLGILVGLSTRPIRSPETVERVFDVFVDSLSAEILRNQAEAALVNLGQQVLTVMNGIPAGVVVADEHSGGLTFANETFSSMLGYDQQQLMAMKPADLHPADQVDAVMAEFEKMMQGQSTVASDIPIRRADGTVFPAEIRGALGELNGRRSLFGVFADITERKLAEARMREALVVFNTSSQGIMTTDAGGIITAINPAFSAITGYSPDEVIGKRPSILKSGRHGPVFYEAMWAALTDVGHWEGEIWNRRHNGQIYPQWLTISSVQNSAGAVIEHVSMFSDITERKQQEEAIWRQANFDALTGLANRNLLADRLERALANAKRNGKKVGLAFLDLDGFKWINDTLGHDVGDQLLVEVGQRLRDCVRDQDTAARLGGTSSRWSSTI